MRDLKIKPGMDTPKAKLKNPAPKDADSLLKQHMEAAAGKGAGKPRSRALRHRPRGEKYAPGCGWGGGCLAAYDKALSGAETAR